jgi:hypothetical protein
MCVRVGAGRCSQPIDIYLDVRVWGFERDLARFVASGLEGRGGRLNLKQTLGKKEI